MGGKRATPDRAIAEIAALQHGVVSVAQLLRVGVSDDAIRARYLIGRLHRVHRGVYPTEIAGELGEILNRRSRAS